MSRLYCELVNHHSRMIMSRRGPGFEEWEAELYEHILVELRVLRPMLRERKWLNVVLRLEMRFVSL